MRQKALIIFFLLLSLLNAGCEQFASENTPADSTDTYISLDTLDISECVESVTYKGLEAEMLDTVLTDEEFAVCLLNLQNEYATTTEITDRNVEKGDTIHLDYIAKISETLITDFWQDGAVISVGEGTTFAEFEDALVGRPCGEAFTVDVVLPESISGEYSGQTVQVLVMINYIESEQVVPELTDAFVSSLEGWNCSTVDDFKEVYRNYMAEQKLYFCESQYQDDLWEQVIASVVYTDTGKEYIDFYCRQQLEKCQSDAEDNNMTLDTMAVNNGYESGEALLDAVEENAAEKAGTQLIMLYIADAEGITYTEDDYYTAVDDYASYMGFASTADMITEYGLEYIEETLGNGLLYDLVRNYVAANSALRGGNREN